MAVPRKKVSKSKRNMRRSHSALTPTNFVICPYCGESKLPHHVCEKCGKYNGHQILEDKRQES